MVQSDGDDIQLGGPDKHLSGDPVKPLLILGLVSLILFTGAGTWILFRGQDSSVPTLVSPTQTQYALNPMLTPKSQSTPAQPIVNQTLAALPTRPKPTVTPGPLVAPVCVEYYQTAARTSYMRGEWTEDTGATASLQGCLEWMNRHKLQKVDCGQSWAVAAIVLLLDKSRLEFDMPDDINMDTEFVVSQQCIK